MRLNGVGFFTVVVENQEKDKWNPFVSRVCVVRLVQPGRQLHQRRLPFFLFRFFAAQDALSLAKCIGRAVVNESL